MEDTSITLLVRLQRSGDAEAWLRLVSLYQPLLIGWLRKYEVQTMDVDDLVQDVLMAVSQGLKNFEHNRRAGAFRSWLRSILVNRLRNFWRTRDRHPVVVGGSSIEERLAQLEDPTSESSRKWDREHDRQVLSCALEFIRPNFSAKTWKIFTRVAIHGERPESVASSLGVSINSVFIAKSRVLSSLRIEVAGIVES